MHLMYPNPGLATLYYKHAYNVVSQYRIYNVLVEIRSLQYWHLKPGILVPKLISIESAIECFCKLNRSAFYHQLLCVDSCCIPLFSDVASLLFFCLYLFLLLKMHTVDIQNSNNASSKCMPKYSYKWTPLVLNPRRCEICCNKKWNSKCTEQIARLLLLQCKFLIYNWSKHINSYRKNVRTRIYHAIA
jgi:hypothetical protein